MPFFTYSSSVPYWHHCTVPKLYYVYTVDIYSARLVVPHTASRRFFRLLELVCPLFRPGIGRHHCHPSALGFLLRRCRAGQGDRAPTRRATNFNEEACALRCSSFTPESLLASWQRYVPPCRAKQFLRAATTTVCYHTTKVTLL